MKKLIKLIVAMVAMLVTSVSVYAEFDYPYGAEDEVRSYSLPVSPYTWESGFCTYGQYKVDGMYYCVLDYGRREAALVANHPVFETGVLSQIACEHENTCLDWEKGSLEGDIVIPNTIELDGKKYSVIAIGYGAFYGCENIRSVKLPNTLYFISNFAFRGCSQLKEIKVPRGCYIAPEAFNGCAGLKKLDMSFCKAPGIKLYESTALEEVKLPDMNPEWHCGFVPIYLGECETCLSVYSFAANAFNAMLDFIPIDGIDNKYLDRITLYVPIGSYDSYRNHKDWCEVKNIVESEEAAVTETIIESEDEPVYYDLQGRQIANPTKGIFIERRGSTVRKILR